MRIAMAQISSNDDLARNRAVIEEYVYRSASAGADLVVLPENAAYRSAEDVPRLPPHSEDINGEFVCHLRDLADKHGIAIVAGMAERIDGEETRAYNTIVAIDQYGKLIGSYRKIHLFDALGSQESEYVIPGDGSTLVFPFGDQIFGAAICYDLRFPEIARDLVDQGATVLLYPSAWVGGTLKEMHWEVLLRARAIENVAWVVGVSQCERNRIGFSMAIDPMGTVRASLGNSEGLAIVDLDKETLDSARNRNPSLQNRRYGIHHVSHSGVET